MHAVGYGKDNGVPWRARNKIWKISMGHSYMPDYYVITKVTAERKEWYENHRR